MKRLFVTVALVVVALAIPALAAAHPLGNFTTNRHAEVVFSGDRVYLHYVLDLAEIPTFQARGEVTRLGRAGYARRLVERIRTGVRLSVDGAPRPLEPLGRSLVFAPGAGGLETSRLEAVFDAGPAGSALAVRDETFGDRLGWREIVVRAERGARILASSVPAASTSDRLRAYPEGRLQSPLDVTAADARAEPGHQPGVAPAFGAGVVPEPSSHDGFASLIEEQELSAGFVLVALALALFWGAAHALTPGHGKAIVAAYLLGTRGRARDALALGGIVTVTHTIGVFTLGAVTLLLSELIVPEDLYPWLNLVSAVLVLAVGVTVLRRRILAARAPRSAHHHGHDHGHDHGHHHDHHDHDGMSDEEHARAHLPQAGAGRRGLLAVGVSGGLLPCPTALVVLLAAISLQRVAFGMVLIVAFSVGLAAVVSAIGLLAIGARRTFSRLSFDGPVVRALPAVSALAVLGIGVAMTVRALPGVV
jgi:ABC-type nickel/cobalt efflux system permease component RcnA